MASRSRSSSVVAAQAVPTRSSAGYRVNTVLKESYTPSVSFEKAGSVDLLCFYKKS